MNPSRHATGTFKVTLRPQPDTGFAARSRIPAALRHKPKLARRRSVRQVQGDRQAASRGQMLSAVTSTAGSAGYDFCDFDHMLP